MTIKRYSLGLAALHIGLGLTAMLLATSALAPHSASAAASSVPASVGLYSDVPAVPVVTASSAYASGNAVGGLLTFRSIALPNSGGRIEEVTLYAKSAQTAEVDFVWCGLNNPSASTITDKTAVSIAAADFAKCRVIAQLTNWQSLGTVSVATSGQIASPFSINGGVPGYGFLVTRGAPTFSSTSDLQVSLRVGY